MDRQCRHRVSASALLASVAILIWLAQPAVATFPGRSNGRIAYVSNGNIWTVNPDGTAPIQVTLASSTDADPRWSPDGKHITFDRKDNVSNVVSVWIMNADGSNLKQVTQGSGPTWSPDGRWIAYSTLRSNPNWGAQPTIYKVRLASGGTVQVTHPSKVTNRFLFAADTFPAWSPDGTTISFVRYFFESLDSTEALMTIKGGKEKTLVGGSFGPYDYFAAAPSWGPGGKYLLYGDQATATAGIYQLAPGGTPSLVVAGTWAEAPVWAPHLGTQIVYQNAPSGGPPPNSLYVAAASGASPQMIVANGSEPDWQPIP